MKATPGSQITQNGRMMMLYGPTGVGKTTTIIQTAPMPIAYIQTEPRSLKPSIDSADRDGLQLMKFMYEDADDLMEFLANGKNLQDFRGGSIVVDGYSHLMNVSLAEEITTEAYEARAEDKKKIKSLAQKTKMTVEGQGVRNTLMFRITNALMKYAADGFTVIITALEDSKPKWDRALAGAPSLAAKEFPTNMPGFFDLIGRLSPRLNDDGTLMVDENFNPVYPPWVDFVSNGTFIAKFTGVGNARSGVLDIEKILAANSK